MLFDDHCGAAMTINVYIKIRHDQPGHLIKPFFSVANSVPFFSDPFELVSF